MTAAWQKIFSDNPKLGYFEQASVYRQARDAGDLLAPATTTSQMDQIITNSMVNGTLQATFALLVLVIVGNAVVVSVRALRSHQRRLEVPTSEVAKTELPVG